MALSPEERLMIVEQTLRGLEADRINAEILYAADEDALQRRLEVLDAQEAAAHAKHEEETKAVESQASEDRKDERTTAIAAVADVDPSRFYDDYDNLTKDGLVERARLKRVDHLLNASDTKDDIKCILRSDDVRNNHIGPA